MVFSSFILDLCCTSAYSLDTHTPKKKAEEPKATSVLDNSSETLHCNGTQSSPPHSLAPSAYVNRHFPRPCLFSRMRKSWSQGTFLTERQPVLRTKADLRHWPISFLTVVVAASGLNKQSGSVRLPALPCRLVFWSLSQELQLWKLPITVSSVVCSVVLECKTNPSGFSERKGDIRCKWQFVLPSLCRSQHHLTIHSAFTEANVSAFLKPIIFCHSCELYSEWKRFLLFFRFQFQRQFFDADDVHVEGILASNCVPGLGCVLFTLSETVNCSSS